MKIVIHRGTHQIGGCATEISTRSTRIIIDMGDELTLDDNYIPQNLEIDGVTNNNQPFCDAVLFTHYHPDHTHQLGCLASPRIPVYMGALTRDILICNIDKSLKCLNAFNPKPDSVQDTIKTLKLQTLPKVRHYAQNAVIFRTDTPFVINDITITPIECDHSAIDSYMFLIEADGKRILHTGDFRTNGFSASQHMASLPQKVGHVDIVIMEGTTLYACMEDSEFFDPLILPAPQAETLHLPHPASELELQNTAKSLFESFHHVFIMTSTTCLERIFAFAKVVPPPKTFIVDAYQNDLINIVQKHRLNSSDLYNIKKPFVAFRADISSKTNILGDFKKNGVVLLARNTHFFRNLIRNLDPDNSLFIYSMWDGYRRKFGSTIDSCLSLASRWTQLHTGGHASMDGLKQFLSITSPDAVIPIHTEHPELLQTLYDPNKIHILQDHEVFNVQ